MNVGDFLPHRLAERGVTGIYGCLWDGSNGITGTLARADDRIDFVQVRHEEMSA